MKQTHFKVFLEQSSVFDQLIICLPRFGLVFILGEIHLEKWINKKKKEINHIFGHENEGRK